MLPWLQNGLERGLRDSQTNLKSLLIGACGVTRDAGLTQGSPRVFRYGECLPREWN